MPQAIGRSLGDQTPEIDGRLAQVAEIFTLLQAERHDADYNFSRRYARPEVDDLLKQAEEAFAAWGAAGKHESAPLFLLALLVMSRIEGR
jgi:hypothetical protein